jgi:hypothetical protein
VSAKDVPPHLPSTHTGAPQKQQGLEETSNSDWLTAPSNAQTVVKVYNYWLRQALAAAHQ